MWFLARRLFDAARADRPAIDLFYGARSSDELHYVDEFRAIGVKVHIATDDGSRGYKGMVTGLLRDKLGVKTRPPRHKKKEPAATQLGMFDPAPVPPPAPAATVEKAPPPVFCACGPMPMLRAVHDVAAALGAICEVSLESRMACGIGVCLGCAHETAEGGLMHVCKDGPVVDSRVVFGSGVQGGTGG
ncbi:MAG: hypothetical protein HY897_21405 [Deltaproteobacteria bacterium]|nr:hypothetical protein [Deltaproteobacteria bacterium]